MTGKDVFRRRVHINFPFAPCYDGSLMFFRKFENESNDSFTLYFYDEEMMGVQLLIDQWLYNYTNPLVKLWEINQNPIDKMHMYFNKKWVARDVDVIVEDYWGSHFIERVDRFWNVIPTSLSYNGNSITFHYDYCTTDFYHNR